MPEVLPEFLPIVLPELLPVWLQLVAMSLEFRDYLQRAALPILPILLPDVLPEAGAG